MTGVALAVIFVLAVAIALAVVPPATPAASVGRQANAQVSAPTRTTITVRPPTAFVGGTTHDAITISWRKPRPSAIASTARQDVSRPICSWGRSMSPI